MRRVILSLTCIGALALLTVWVVSGYGPASNETVYAFDTVVEATVTTTDPDVQLRVASVDPGLLQDAGVFLAQAAVVLTTSAGVTVEPASVPGTNGWTVQPALLDRADQPTEAPVELPEGSTFVALLVTELSPELGFATPVLPLDQVVSVDLPVLRDGDEVATLSVGLTPVPVTGNALGIPGPVGVPEERLPRPAVGEAIPTMLQADRHPVWVVGLEDGVAVLDARSPHLFSGLVGWCGQMPGFIDSIGGSRFTATGQYAFGPAPHGLVPYDVQVADDHVTVTRRLAPPSRFAGFAGVEPLPAIEGSPVEQSGYCDIDSEVFARANEDGYFLEDFRDSPSWVQHDLSAWPDLDQADGDGWWRTDAVDVEGLPRLVGDLLVRLERGRVVDAAAPPGVARQLFSFDVPAETRTMQVGAVLTGSDGALAELRDVIWITPDGAFPAAADPAEPRTLVSGTQPSTYVLPDDTPTLQEGDLVEVTIDEGRITAITER